MKHLVGVDVGGSKIVAGVFGEDWELLDTATRSTKPERGPKDVVRRVARAVRDAVDEADLDFGEVTAVGVGVPGTVDSERRRVVGATRLGWRDFDLGDELEEHLGVPVRVENVGSLAALGVQKAEMRGRPRNLVGIFVGSGIRGGMIVEGDLPRRIEPGIEDLGHRVFLPEGPPCACGRRGCFETLASRTAMHRRFRTALAEGRESVLAAVLADTDRLRSSDVHRALLQGDSLAREVVDETARWIGWAVAELVGIHRPEVLVLGGGILETLADAMADGIVESARERAGREVLEGTEVFVSSLGSYAAVTGAAVLAGSR